jgi:hypothetical protein
MPARWSAKFDQPVTGLAVAAELPWVWIPRSISPRVEIMSSDLD